MKPTLTKPTLATIATLDTRAAAARSFSEVKQDAPEPENAAGKPRAFTAPKGHRRLTINLPENLHKQLRQAALDQDCNATDIIVELLTKKFST